VSDGVENEGRARRRAVRIIAIGGCVKDVGGVVARGRVRCAGFVARAEFWSAAGGVREKA